jgi:hypothetical protein
MRPFRHLSLLSLLAVIGATAHAGTPAFLKFSGAIGVDPLTAAGGVDVSNVVRGISPGGRAWVIRKFSATVGADGSISARGKGLLFSSGDAIATRGSVAAVAVTLFCGAADATARRFTSPGTALDQAGNFSIRGLLSEDGVNAAVLPATCDNPQLLVRAFNATTQTAGGWFAAGIVGDDDD